MAQIENKRLEMYNTSANHTTYENLLIISQELDQLLNQLADIQSKE